MRRLLFTALLLILWPGVARSGDGGAPGPSFESKLNSELQGSWVVSVTDLGDILLFGGAINVPVHRPSVERCGEWLTVPPEGRAKKTEELLKEADRTALDQRLSKAERQELKKKTLSPLRACESDFKRRCEEARTKTPPAARKSAVASAKKAIEDIVNQKDAAAARTYLATILKQCALEE